MESNPLKQGILTENSIGIGTVSRGMVRRRAVELALIDGRQEHEVSVTDWDRAKRELTGEPALDPKDEILEAAPESDRWNLSDESKGHKAPTASSEDEDGEGRSDSQRLVEQGVSEAEHNQMVEAAHQQRKQDNVT